MKQKVRVALVSTGREEEKENEEGLINWRSFCDGELKSHSNCHHRRKLLVFIKNLRNHTF